MPTPREDLARLLGLWRGRYSDDGCNPDGDILALRKAIDAVLTEPQGHPETIQHEGETYRLVGKGPGACGWGREKNPVLVVAPSGEVIAYDAYDQEAVWVVGALSAGAALYRLVEPRVWEWEQVTQTSGVELKSTDSPIPAGVKVKVVATEVIEGVPSKEQP